MTSPDEVLARLDALPLGAACAVGTKTEAASTNPNANETVLLALIRNTPFNEVNLRLFERSDASDLLSSSSFEVALFSSSAFHARQKKVRPGHFCIECADRKALSSRSPPEWGLDSRPWQGST
jgi:hypothetical protein